MRDQPFYEDFEERSFEQFEQWLADEEKKYAEAWATLERMQDDDG